MENSTVTFTLDGDFNDSGTTRTVTGTITGTIYDDVYSNSAGSGTILVDGSLPWLNLSTASFDLDTGEITVRLILGTGTGFFDFTLTTGTSGSLTGSPFDAETNAATVVNGSRSSTIDIAVSFVVIPDWVEPVIYPGQISGLVGVRGRVFVAGPMNIEGFVGVAGSIVRPRRPIEPGTDPGERVERRRVVIVDMQGTPLTQGFLADATQGPITWTRSAPTSFSVSLPLDSDSARMLLGDGSDKGVDTPYREAQLWRGDQLLTWGPLHSMSVDGDVLELQGHDASWYLTRRSIGPAGRVNMLTNPDLQSGADGWFMGVSKGFGYGTHPNTPETNITRSRLPSDRTKWGIRIEDRTPIFQEVDDVEFTIVDPTQAPVYATAQQFFVIPTQQVQTRLTFSCWIDVEEFLSRNDDDSSIFIGLFPAGASSLTDLVAVEFAGFPDDILPGQRFRAEVSIDVPAGQWVWGVANVRSCKGVSYASDFWLEWDGGLTYLVQDKAVIMRDLVHHLSGSGAGSTQARRYPLFPHHGPATYGKSDVRIKPSVKKSGFNLTRLYDFTAGGGDGIGALTDLAEDDATSGWAMQFSDTDRSWHAMRNLGVRWDCPVRWVPSGGNLSGFGWQFMGEQGANVVNVFSAIPGSRDQGTAIDPSAFGGLTIEDALTAVQDTADENLQLTAATHLAGTTRPVALALKLPANPYFTDRALGVGQVIPVTISHGALKIVGLYRIYSLTLTENDHLELVATPAQVPGAVL